MLKCEGRQMPAGIYLNFFSKSEREPRVDSREVKEGLEVYASLRQGGL